MVPAVGLSVGRRSASFCALAAVFLFVAGCGGGAPSAAGLVTPTGTAPEVSQAPTASPSAAATGLRQVASFAGATLHVDPLAFSPDGRTLAGNEGSEKRVRLWDVETGKATATITAPGNVSVGFTPDGQALATGYAGYGAQLWDVGTGTSTATFPNPVTTGANPLGGSGAVAVSPDGKTLASIGNGGGVTSVLLWDVATGKNITKLTPRSSVLLCLAFSPDGKTIAAGGNGGGVTNQGNVYTWQVATGTPGPTLRLATTDPVKVIGNKVSSLAFSPDGKTIAGAGFAGPSYLQNGAYTGTQIWDVTTGTVVSTVTDTGGGSVAFSPDGATLATTLTGGTGVELWDVAAGKATGTITLPTNSAMTAAGTSGAPLAFNPDGKTLAVGVGGTVQLWALR